MLTKVYVAQSAFEQALEILNLLYYQMRKEKCMFERSELHFLAAGNKVHFRISWHRESIPATYTFS
jgi:hypothetical protein